MTEEQELLARACLEGAESGAMTFPEVLAALSRGGFESYAVDFRRGATTYYLPSGDSIALQAHALEQPVAAAFDVQALGAAIREAQALAPGYTYRGFCEKAKAAGCVGYAVSLLGRRVLYVGRTAETHVEHFPA